MRTIISGKWVCSCGVEFSGDQQGWGDAMVHQRQHKTQEDGEAIIGLASVETGEVLVNGLGLKTAYAKGYIDRPVKKEDGKQPAAGGKKTASKVSGPSQARVKYRDIELNPILDVLYELARLKYPGEYDDTKTGFGEFILDTVMSFFQEHAEELGFDLLLANAMKINQEVESIGRDHPIS